MVIILVVLLVGVMTRTGLCLLWHKGVNVRAAMDESEFFLFFMTKDQILEMREALFFW